MKMRKISIVILTLAILPILVGVNAGNSQYSWPMLHNDPLRTGYTSSFGPNVNKTLWVYDTSHDLYGPSPAVVGGMLYITGGYGPSVFALNATTGMQVWNFTGTTWISSSPAVAYGLVYFGSFDTNVTALNATTGALAWNYTTGGWLAASSPAVADGIVYIGGGYKNGVFALNATTGEKIWNYTTQGQVHSSPAVASGVVYIGSFDKNLYAFNATTGEKIWNYSTANSIFSSPAVANGVVYIGSYDQNVYALNATNGNKIWNYTTGNWVASSPAIFADVVYVGSYDNNVYAFNASSGEKIWNYSTSGAISSSPAIAANNIVYIGSGDNNTYALDAQTGAKIWSYQTGGDVFSSPAVADGVVYAPSRDGKIYAIVGTQQVFDATWQAQTYPVTVSSDSALSDFQFVQQNMQLSINATGPTGMQSFCNLTIPKSLLTGPWVVKVDGKSVTPIVVENDTHSFVYVPYTHSSTQVVTIEGAWVVSEFPTGVFVPALLITTFVIALATRTQRPKRKKQNAF
jgi:outer membrane protein assembly factor BamB